MVMIMSEMRMIMSVENDSARVENMLRKIMCVLRTKVRSSETLRSC